MRTAASRKPATSGVQVCTAPAQWSGGTTGGASSPPGRFRQPASRHDSQNEGGPRSGASFSCANVGSPFLVPPVYGSTNVMVQTTEDWFVNRFVVVSELDVVEPTF